MAEQAAMKLDCWYHGGTGCPAEWPPPANPCRCDAVSPVFDPVLEADGMVTFISAGIIGLSIGAQYALIAIGFTLIFGILGVVNFAHGGFYVLGGYLAYSLSHTLGVPFPLAVALAAVGTGVLGYIVEVLLVERYVVDHLATMLITLGFYQILITAIVVVYGGEPVDFMFPLSGALRSGGVFIQYSHLIVFAVCGASIAFMYWLVYKTRYGIALRAMADDGVVARSQGIPAATMFPMAFAIATALAGLTGALVTPMLSLDPHVGEGVLLKAFIVVILGGMGSIPGAMLAAVAVGLIESYSAVYLGGSKGALVLFVIVVLILLVRPQGLLGTQARRA
jgi:branched-chain amino acid transport system permease protein